MGEDCGHRTKIVGHFLIPGLITALAAIVGCSWLSWQLLRQIGRILLRLEEVEKRVHQLEFGEPQAGGLPLGSPAPDFDLPALGAERKTLGDLRGQSLLLIFFNPGCGFCRDLVPRLAALGIGNRTSEDDQRLAASAATNGHPLPLIIASGDLEQNRRIFAKHQFEYPVLLQQEMEVSAAYGVRGTPSGYLIDAEGKIASEFALGAERLLVLANGTAETRILKPKMDRARAGEAGSTLTSSEEDERANRFRNHSLARSKINRSGLKPARPRPIFSCHAWMERANCPCRLFAAGACSSSSPAHAAGHATNWRPNWRDSTATNRTLSWL